LDSALAIPYDIDNIKDFGSIEEEILSRTLPKQWGKISLAIFAINCLIHLKLIIMI